MRKINGLKIALCQMKVAPGRPDLNADYICQEIRQAKEAGADIIVFPEMAVTGYLIGDLYEDISFIEDVQRCNEVIRLATSIGIVAIFGSVEMPGRERRGEDGRMRIQNAVMIAQDGRWIGKTVKFLQPNYRIFDDDRHFYSLRKVREEYIELEAAKCGHYDQEDCDLDCYFNPFILDIGERLLTIGAIICEDMWHSDYHYNPAKVLAGNGAEIIFNLSASPWTWQKNRKRHRVVKDLLSECHVPLVYVNNTGIQNNGKNIIIFDGSSTVYDRQGERIYSVPAYQSGTFHFTMSDDADILMDEKQDDTTELYQAIKCAISEFIQNLPTSMRRVIIGLSGGIDSALSLALFTDILGPDNVIAVNMPSYFNSRQTRAIAKQMADNLGVRYEVRPIGEIVEAIAKTTGTKPDTPSFANIMARTRMEVLAAMAQDNDCVYIANWNKIEAAFGYGTLYGDMAGFMAPLGDLTKREVYQLAEYLNRTVFRREVIPQACFDLAPSAELKENQTDPFDYGHLRQRGYHDEMVRAFVEFRRNPEWFLSLYLDGNLEKELLLPPGRIKELFVRPADFVRDLERSWGLFFGSYFKRVQSAPIPIVSKRAFGYDLRESILSPHLTRRYLKLKELVLSEKLLSRHIVIYGGSFNPPGKHHYSGKASAEKEIDGFIDFLSQPQVPACADFSDLAWLYDIGYREMMLCDEICLKDVLLSAAVNTFHAFRLSYRKQPTATGVFRMNAFLGSFKNCMQKR